jgi:hypothetical protein
MALQLTKRPLLQKSHKDNANSNPKVKLHEENEAKTLTKKKLK